MISYGIMQGRLTPSNGRGIQFFPFENWQKEFYDTQAIGLNEIEWVFDYDRYEENPLWSEKGCLEINQNIKNSGIIVNSLNFDYFMRRPFYKLNEETQRKQCLRENKEIFSRVLYSLSSIGGKLLEIPMVDASSVKTDEEEKRALEFVRWVAEEADSNGIKVALETDFPPGKFISFLEKIDDHFIYANFDSGNSSGLGYDAIEEIGSLGTRIFNVHIKDRVYKGTTVQLGTGSADFDKVFTALKQTGYKNSFILQAARSEDGLEIENISKQLAFVKKYVTEYSIGE